MRAMSVKVNEVIGVAGFTVPGTRVDVLVTVNRQNESMARAVVSNVQVLTAGTRYDAEQAKDGKPQPTTVVTLMVTPEDAERIALAQNTGAIMLVLRNPMDVAPTDTHGVRMASLMGTPDAAPAVKTVRGQQRVVTPKPAVAVPTEPKLYSVEAIRAAKRTEEVIR
jgi:pilus assembly protein CpaB